MHQILPFFYQFDEFLKDKIYTLTLVPDSKNGNVGFYKSWFNHDFGIHLW